MTIRKTGHFIVLLLSVPWIALAQGKADFYKKPYRQGNGFSIRGGVNYSMPTVTAYYVSGSNFTSTFGGIRPRFGYYIGGSYFTDLLPERVSLRIDATLQLKQTANVGLVGSLVGVSRYYYAGLRPMLGLQLTRRLMIHTGVEANVLLASQHSWGHAAPLDVGSTVRGSYQFGLFRLELGYYRGFVKYDRFDSPFGQDNFGFYNQTYEAGLIYTLK